MATYNTTTADGYVGRDNAQATWTAARDTADGQSTNTSNAADNVPQSTYNSGLTVYYNYRYFLYFDTSSIPSSAIISAASLSVYCTDHSNNANTTSVEIVTSTQGASLAVGDYDAYTNTSIGSKNIADFTDSAFNEITITDLTKITKAGTTKLALITGRDLNNQTPTGNNYVTLQTGDGTNKPYLAVTYTLPSGGQFFITFS